MPFGQQQQLEPLAGGGSFQAVSELCATVLTPALQVPPSELADHDPSRVLVVCTGSQVQQQQITTLAAMHNYLLFGAAGLSS